MHRGGGIDVEETRTCQQVLLFHRAAEALGGQNLLHLRKRGAAPVVPSTTTWAIRGQSAASIPRRIPLAFLGHHLEQVDPPKPMVARMSETESRGQA